MLKWIDAAKFAGGGWKLDTQFSHLCGSAFMLACERPGEPVGSAEATVTLPCAAKCRVWLRTRNWYYTHSPGLMKLSVNGVTAAGPFGGELRELGGAPSPDWVWQIAGDFEFAAGDNTIAVTDLTGYFGRFACAVVTDDFDYVPPRPVAEFERERARALGLDLTPRDAGEYDVLVAGAGPGGVPAAIAAARHGSRVLLVSNRPVLGGNSSTEAGVGFNGASARQTNAREGGINEELTRLKAYLGCSWSKALAILVENEPNITVLYNYHVSGAETRGDEIKSVTLRHAVEGTYLRASAKEYIDCTGDGWLGYHAGAKYHVGREAKWQYGEEFAPETADTRTMSGCVMGSSFTDVGHPVEYTAPDWVPRFPKGRAFGRNIERVGSAWWNEAPNDIDDIYDAELARDELFRIMLGYFNYLKNDWDEKERAANYEFARMRILDAKRESRRFIGDYTLTQTDCVTGKHFADVVAHTGWPIDLHHPKGMYSGSEGPFFSNTHVPLVELPYRCLYSKNIKNLLFAGRCEGISHIALGTARVQATIAAAAQAAGTAAAMCAAKSCTPRDIYLSHLAELQQTLIKDDQFIPRHRNELPNDAARMAGTVISATSEKKTELYYPHLGVESELMPIDRQRATFFARGVEDYVGTVWLKLANLTSSPLDVTARFRVQADPDGYTTEEDCAVVTRTLKPDSEEWVPFEVGVTSRLRYMWVWIDRTDGAAWRIMKYPALDWTRSERVSESEKFENIRWQCHCVSLEAPDERAANCSAANVVGGYDRIIDHERYMWVSEKPLPQSITLTLPEPRAVRELHLTFDADMNNPPMLNPMPKVPEPLAQDYVVEVSDGEAWFTIADVRDNFQRKRVHTVELPQITATRVTVTRSQCGEARIFKLMLVE